MFFVSPTSTNYSTSRQKPLAWALERFFLRSFTRYPSSMRNSMSPRVGTPTTTENYTPSSKPSNFGGIIFFIGSSPSIPRSPLILAFTTEIERAARTVGGNLAGFLLLPSTLTQSREQGGRCSKPAPAHTSNFSSGNYRV